MPEDLEARLRALEDREAIRELRATYCFLIDDGRASGDCHFELTATDVASGEDVVGACRYIDRYRREGDRWRFAERRAEIFFIAPRAEGWNRQHFIGVLAGWG